MCRNGEESETRLYQVTISQKLTHHSLQLKWCPLMRQGTLEWQSPGLGSTDNSCSVYIQSPDFVSGTASYFIITPS